MRRLYAAAVLLLIVLAGVPAIPIRGTQQRASYATTARVTHYWATGSPMTSGDYPYVGAVACSYDIPLYSWINVGGDSYQCLDRGLLGDGSYGYSWIDFYGFDAEAYYGEWTTIYIE